MESLVKLIVLDYFDCDAGILKDKNYIQKIMLEAAEAMGAKVINYTFNLFNPHGVSGTVTIAESHLAIHTWPEYRYAAVDFEVCGRKIDPWEGYHILFEKLKAKRSSQFQMSRGLFDVPPGSLPHKQY